MIYSDKHKVVFIAIPKTGTRSVYNTMQKNYGAVLYKEHHNKIPEKYKDYYSFTIVRNPYDRFISTWWSIFMRDGDLIKGKASKSIRSCVKGSDIKVFMSWLLKGNSTNHAILKKQSDYLNNNFDMILTNESLNDDFKKLHFINSAHSLPNINSTTSVWGANTKARNPDIFTYIDQELLEMINEHYAEDFYNLPQYKQIFEI
tara:strand:+ start:483 stop:1088 length:606 start_codon:yes stop_codon:yes gene_type:complete